MPPFPRHGLMVRVCAVNGCTSVLETKLEGGGMRMRKCPGNGCASDANRTDVTDPEIRGSGVCGIKSPHPTHKSKANYLLQNTAILERTSRMSPSLNNTGVQHLMKTID